MKVIGINGSPRKKWNTATLLGHALEGAARNGAETELIHLYDLDFKGCVSCFACKTKNGKNYGHCAFKDALTPVLDKIMEADALIIGSPIYFGSVTGETRSFFERLLFPLFTYENPPRSLAKKPIKVGFIYTMNIDTEEKVISRGLDKHLQVTEGAMKMIFGNTESLYSMDTYQFEDYSKVVFEYMDVKQKEKTREQIFPVDCKKANVLGLRLTRKTGEQQ
jgi:multimeric flavodoxin WrbA